LGGWAGYGTSRKCKSVKKRGQVKNKLCKAAKQSKGLGQTKRSETKRKNLNPKQRKSGKTDSEKWNLKLRQINTQVRRSGKGSTWNSPLSTSH